MNFLAGQAVCAGQDWSEYRQLAKHRRISVKANLAMVRAK